jgi:TonB family protein
VLERAAIAALEEYRFCAPAGLPSNAQWTARMRFTSSPIADRFGGGQMVVQLFLPAYTRDDVSSHRSGTNRVRGVFGPDGRPTTVRLTTTSGDAVLDHKSLEAMASYQLVFRPGTVLTHPLTFEQPYTYEIH